MSKDVGIGSAMSLRCVVVSRGMSKPLLWVTLGSISKMALELDTTPFSFMLMFWAEQEAHPKSFPKGRTCIKKVSKNIAVKQIANCTLYLVPCTLILLFFILHCF